MLICCLSELRTVNKFENIIYNICLYPTMSTLNLELGFNVPRHILYEAIINQQLIMQYTRAPASSDAKQGGEFSILDGRIVGRYLTLRKGEYIKMEWRFSDWKESSIVEIILRDPEEDETDVYLTQTKIPASEKKEKIEFGWKQYIFGGINKILGYPYKD